jgi:hypothetical protein
MTERGRPEVAKAMMQFGSTTRSRLRRMVRLTERSSVAASSTYSHCTRSLSSIVGTTRATMSSAVFSLSLPRAMPLATYPRMRCMPASSASWRMSCR